jgi:thiol:disulfide interchange protein
MRRFLIAVLLMMMTVVTGHAGEDDPLPAEEAFKFSAGQGQAGSVELSWTIAEGYYLYRDHMEATSLDGGRPVSLNLPEGVKKVDPNFGSTEVYHDAVTASSSPPTMARSRSGTRAARRTAYAPADRQDHRHPGAVHHLPGEDRSGWSAVSRGRDPNCLQALSHPI